MIQAFISHVAEDEGVALALSKAIESAGFCTWYYERDSLPGLSYIMQVGQAIDGCNCVVLLISMASIGSHQVTTEVVRAYEEHKPIIPVLIDVSHEHFQKRQPEWRTALGATTSVNLATRGQKAVEEAIVGALTLMATNQNAANPRSDSSASKTEAIAQLGVTWQEQLSEIQVLLRAGNTVAVVTDLCRIASGSHLEAPNIWKEAKIILISVLEKETEPIVANLINLMVDAERRVVIDSLAILENPIRRKGAWNLCSAIYLDSSPRLQKVLARESYIDCDESIHNQACALLALVALVSHVGQIGLDYSHPEIGDYCASRFNHLSIGTATTREQLIDLLSRAWKDYSDFDGFNTKVKTGLLDIFEQMGLGKRHSDDSGMPSDNAVATIRKELLQIGKGTLWTVLRDMVGDIDAPTQVMASHWMGLSNAVYYVVEKLGDARFVWPILEYYQTYPSMDFPIVFEIERVIRKLVGDKLLADKLLDHFGRQEKKELTRSRQNQRSVEKKP